MSPKMTRRSSLAGTGTLADVAKRFHVTPRQALRWRQLDYFPEPVATVAGFELFNISQVALVMGLELWPDEDEALRKKLRARHIDDEHLLRFILWRGAADPWAQGKPRWVGLHDFRTSPWARWTRNVVTTKCESLVDRGLLDSMGDDYEVTCRGKDTIGVPRDLGRMHLCGQRCRD